MDQMEKDDDGEIKLEDLEKPLADPALKRSDPEQAFKKARDEIGQREDLSDEEKMKLLFDTHTIEMPSLTPIAKYSRKPFFDFFKRCFDIFASGLGIIILSPLFLVMAIIIKCSDGGPVFYIQKRVGYYGKKFNMIKFRSMVPNADAKVVELLKQNEASGPMFKIKDDPRITKIGKFMRKTSIDELPQLFNVFAGSMSLVGPRPALPREVTQYTRKETARLLVKPGITCIWQISGRSSLTFEQQVEMDIDYIVRRSVWLDLSILFKTIPAVLSHKGAE
jgi:exopolysaccharide biosynthesis polyprenyl glycosylphosphotransferase